nr:unnamed protein product [Haemonchus contortus]
MWKLCDDCRIGDASFNRHTTGNAFVDASSLQDIFANYVPFVTALSQIPYKMRGQASIGTRRRRRRSESGPQRCIRAPSDKPFRRRQHAVLHSFC